MSVEILERTTGDEAERDLRKLLLTAGWETGAVLSREDLKKKGMDVTLDGCGCAQNNTFST